LRSQSGPVFHCYSYIAEATEPSASRLISLVKTSHSNSLMSGLKSRSLSQSLTRRAFQPTPATRSWLPA